MLSTQVSRLGQSPGDIPVFAHPAPICTLQDDILFSILKVLEPSSQYTVTGTIDVAASIQLPQVCRRFRNLVYNSPVFWRNIDLTTIHLRHCSTVRKLAEKGCQCELLERLVRDLVDKCLEPSRDMPVFVSLASDSDSGNVIYEQLTETKLWEACKRWKTLDITVTAGQCGHQEWQLTDLLKSLDELPALRSFSWRIALGGMSHPLVNAWIEVVDPMAKSGMRRLFLCLDTTQPLTGYPRFLNSGGLKRLTHLILDGCAFGRGNFDDIVNILNAGSQLQWIRFSHVPHSVNWEVNSRSIHTRLQHLVIVIPLDDPGVGRFFKRIKAPALISARLVFGVRMGLADFLALSGKAEEMMNEMNVCVLAALQNIGASL
ncbi:hypothetical protein FA15DRAFT_670387 [Coprinopsis marcescibilis]|uniref:Uncharacterized protein n=1 Tax=Coprinopsis marcescibilis TaxID=230819 RepID=A0A5C3KTP6_COPMA|nr:hypothetical protein FA15DRAFT_670387 [Coprinopsis marcescibilis]